jgi:GTP-binding protein Era
MADCPPPTDPDQPTADAAPSPTLAAELEAVVLDFEDLQAELSYQQAQAALENLVERLPHSARETAGLATEMQRLTDLLDKLNRAVVHIAVFGLVGRGKSSLLNSLLGREVFATGPTHGVTQTVGQAIWEVREEAIADGNSLWRVALPGQGQSRIELIDTPGLDEVKGAARERLAQQVAREADLILFVIAGDITRVEYDALVTLRQASKPMLLVFNKVDQYPDRDRQTIYETLRDQRLRDLISPDEIVMAAAAPLVATATRQPNGRLVTRRQRGQPQVTDLKLKILDILHQEGLSLVALNTLLYADDLHETIVAKKLQIRDRAAEDAIWSGVMAKAIAVALNPILGVDVLAGAAVDIALIVALSRLYGLPMTQLGAAKLLQTIALGLGGISLSELLITLGLGSLKSLLGAAAPATGGLSLPPYLSVAVTQAAVAGVSSYTLGQVTRAYLVNGAAWGPQGPKAVVADILAQLDETSILHRVKAELAAKLGSLSDDFPQRD